MKINQLFKDKIPDDLLIKLLSAFNLKGLDDDTCFSKADLEKIQTVQKIEELKDSFYKYYLPCKFKIYLDKLNDNKCITVLRQILKLFQVKLISRQKYIKYKKITMYSIMRHENNVQTTVQVDHNHTQLFF